MPVIVALIDNDQSVLESYGQLLEQNGCRVLPAATLPQAELLLRERWLHLALVDIRMVDDDDPNDISGLLLAERAEFRRIPKIILTSHRTFELALRALQQDQTGQAPALKYVVKEEGPRPLLDALRQVAGQTVPANWGLAFYGDAGQLPGEGASGDTRSSDTRSSDTRPLAFALLAGQLDPSCAPEQLPELGAELEDLLRLLFRRGAGEAGPRRAVLRRPLWRRPGQLALEVFLSQGSGEQRLVVTCALLETARAGQRAYDRYASPAAGIGGTLLEARAETCHFGALAWRLNGARLEELQTLDRFLQQKPARPASEALENIFAWVLLPWYQHPHTTRPAGSLQDYYCRRFALGPQALPLEHFQEKLRLLAEDARARGMTGLVWDQGTLRLQLGRSARPLHPPLAPLYDPDRPLLSTGPAELFCASPDGPDLETLLVSEQAQAWLAGFSGAQEAPLWHAAAALETAVRFRLLPPADLGECYDLERALLDETDLLDQPRLDGLARGLGEYARLLVKIRALFVQHTHEKELLPYLASLYCHTLAGLGQYNPAGWHSQRETAALLHRLLLASLLAEKFEQLQGAPRLAQALLKRLRVDPDNRRAWVGEQEVSMDKAVFEVLLYLYRRRGQLCPPGEIAAGVLPGSLGDEESWVTTNISRLRKALGGRDFIRTVHGQGYILEAEPGSGDTPPDV